ncbi:MAG: sulfatase-like hydrolase/transferase, partial [bacterium]|nr:sulfatase-like hydrolase/transferase [bacterium]
DGGYHGSEIRTPHIDSIASRGIKLERFYAYPMCSPTRAALLTGRSAVELGVHGPISPRAPHGLPTDEHLLPQAFKNAGYQTYMTGKWHLGLGHVNYFPQNRGFDHFYGHLGPSLDYFSRIIAGGLDWQRNGATVREEGYTTELLTAEAVKLIRERDQDRPLLLYVTFNAVHAPLQAPQAYVDRYPNIENPRRRTYAAMTTAMDDGIGRILATLDAEKITADTLILFISDNGGGRGAASNVPLRSGKGSIFEGGIRVPA